MRAVRFTARWSFGNMGKDGDDLTHMLGSGHNSFYTLCDHVDNDSIEEVNVASKSIDCPACIIAVRELLENYSVRALKAIAKRKLT